jgi:hypothetical protein
MTNDEWTFITPFVIRHSSLQSVRCRQSALPRNPTLLFGGTGRYFSMRTPVALFTRRADAEPLQRRLSENGIPAEIHDCKLMSGVRLEVPTDQFERAHRWLVDWDAADGALRQAIRCPECRSLRVEYPQFSRKSIGPNLLIGFLAMIRFTEKEFYCMDCHFTWPKEGSRPSRARPHMAPYYFIEGVEERPASRKA